MAQSPLIAGIARQVRELRDARGWSGQRLAEEMTGKGIPWDRAVVANLESGRRRSVSVEEWLTLARLLDVAPLHLLIPVDAEQVYVTPGDQLAAHDARAWIRGEMPIEDGDRGHYERHQPSDELGVSGRTVAMLRLHARLLPEGGAMTVEPDGTVRIAPGTKFPTRPAEES